MILIFRGSHFAVFFLVGVLSVIWKEPILPKETRIDGLYVRLIERPELRADQTVSLSLKILRSHSEWESADGSRLYCQTVVLPWLNIDKLRAGDEFYVSVTLNSLNRESPGDYRLYLKNYISRCKINYSSYAVQNSDSYVNKLRENIISVVKSSIGDVESRSLLLAMTFGLDSAVSERLYEAFKRSGLAHLMVVSGYQLTVIFMAVGAALKYLFSGSRHFYLTLIVVQIIPLALVSFFGVLAGSANSCLRALIALWLLILSRIYERNSSFLNIIFTTALLLNIIVPGAFLDTGVQLTFAALIGIYLGNRSDNKFKNYVQITFWAGICTSAVVWIIFDRLYPLSLVYNFIFAPCLSILLTQFGITGIILNLSGFNIGKLLIEFLLWCASYTINIIYFISDNLTFEAGALTGILFCLLILLRIILDLRNFLIENDLLNNEE